MADIHIIGRNLHKILYAQTATLKPTFKQSLGRDTVHYFVATVGAEIVD